MQSVSYFPYRIPTIYYTYVTHLKTAIEDSGLETYGAENTKLSELFLWILVLGDLGQNLDGSNRKSYSLQRLESIMEKLVTVLAFQRTGNKANTHYHYFEVRYTLTTT